MHYIEKGSPTGVLKLLSLSIYIYPENQITQSVAPPPYQMSEIPKLMCLASHAPLTNTVVQLSLIFWLVIYYLDQMHNQALGELAPTSVPW